MAWFMNQNYKLLPYLPEGPDGEVRTEDGRRHQAQGL